MKTKYILLPFLFFVLKAQAQLDLGTHFMDGIWQANISNPAFMPEHKFLIALPGFYNQLRIDNFNYSDIIRDGANNNTFIDLDGVIDKMGPNNIIRDQADIPTVALGVRINNVFLTAGHTLHANAFLNYPKELAQLVWDGNAQFIGQSIEIGPDVLLQAYHSFYIGGAGKITENLSAGGRFKILSGIADLSSNSRSLRLSTSDDVYQTNLEADYVINSTGVISYNGFTSQTDVDFNDGNFDFDNLLSSNYGLAFDLGVRWETEDWILSASALDLGAITWRDEATNTRLQGNFEYDGLDIVKDALIDSLGTIDLADTLEATFPVEETFANYSTNLPAKYFLSATFKIDRNWQIGALAFLENFRNEVTTTIGVSTQAKVGGFFTLGGIVSYTEEEPFRVGANTSIRLGPVQLMAATDNLLTAFTIEDSNSANFRVGLNLVFGRDRESDR